MKAFVASTRAIIRQAALTLRLNFRAPLAVVYGYAMPVVFLFAFGGIFRAGSPPLLAEMGQLLTITILGSAALGLPTALVAERERGVWRRHRLLPIAPAALLGGTLLARCALVAGAVVLQLVLAHVCFGTPWPAQPVVFGLAAAVTTLAFLGLGLVIAALADGVPAVQALGQCFFLPMILLGGVGVPLSVLPDWAQRVAGFMPGRYAVVALQHGFVEARGAVGFGFALLALAIVGGCALTIGLLLFRWDASARPGRRPWLGAAFAVGAWVGVGVVAGATGRLRPLLPAGYEWREITPAHIATIPFENLPGDGDLVTRLAPPLARPLTSARLDSIARRLAAWPDATAPNPGQAIRDYVCLATLADLAQDPQEGEIARLVYERLRAAFADDELRRGLAWVVLCPDDGTVVTSAPALGLRREIDEDAVRNRAPLYAEKFLGRVLCTIATP